MFVGDGVDPCAAYKIAAVGAQIGHVRLQHGVGVQLQGTVVEQRGGAGFGLQHRHQRARLIRHDSRTVTAELSVHILQRIERRRLFCRSNMQRRMPRSVGRQIGQAQRGQRPHDPLAQTVMRKGDAAARGVVSGCAFAFQHYHAPMRR